MAKYAKTAKPTKAAKPTAKPDTHPVGRMGKTAHAPTKLATHTHTANDERRRKAATDLHKDAVKARQQGDKESLHARLMKGERLNEVQLNTFPASGPLSLTTYFQANKEKYKGYSALKKAQMVEYIMTGMKPDVEKTESQLLRQEASALKKAGLITGPVSAQKIAVVREAITAAKSGVAYDCKKPPVKEGTMDWHKDLLRNPAGKGYAQKATDVAKSKYGKSISNLKAGELKVVCQLLGLVK